MKKFTLCYIVDSENSSRVMLGKKQLKIGAGLWNGPGGGVEIGEDEAVAASREVREEIGVNINPCDLRRVGVIDFFFHENTSDTPNFHVVIFRAWAFSGTPIDTHEMSSVRWFDLNELPNEMMPADKLFVVPAARGHFVTGGVWFNQDKSGVIRHTLKIS